jgi:hypothetical protein
MVRFTSRPKFPAEVRPGEEECGLTDRNVGIASTAQSVVKPLWKQQKPLDQNVTNPHLPRDGRELFIFPEASEAGEEEGAEALTSWRASSRQGTDARGEELYAKLLYPSDLWERRGGNE